MRSLFLDSDILLDVILIRKEHFNYSVEVIELANNDYYKLCTSVHCLLNIHYAAKKVFGEKLARKSILAIIEKLQIITEDKDIVVQAAFSNFSDFEDAVKYYAAMSAKADVIITRNIKDYKQSRIPVLTAEQFLKTL